MFFANLVIAGFVFACATAVYGVARTRTWWGLTIAVFAGLFGAVMVPAGSPLAFLQALVLAVVGIACTWLRARMQVFAGWAFATSISVIGAVGWLGAHSWSGLAERYPLESLAGRLAYEAPTVKAASADSPITSHYRSPALPLSAEARLRDIEQEGGDFWGRDEALRLVHASFIEKFVRSPGFGIGRMIRPSPDHIEYGDRRASARLRFVPSPHLGGSPEPNSAATPTSDELSATSFGEPLSMLHHLARQDFLDPGSFGYFRDRNHVAGFVPHAFLDGVPHLGTRDRGQGQWLTLRVELVSILKHDRPMVYVSEHLPNMNELREAPVRELDPFERQALTALLAGDDIVSDYDAGGIRAVGSLRAASQCLECHQVKRGALLGAFSYEFLHDPPLRSPPLEKPADGQLL
jgi:hypothetical protein